jgi:hypothetical protein
LKASNPHATELKIEAIRRAGQSRAEGEGRKVIGVCSLVVGLQIASAFLGISAAILWLSASLTKTPKRIPEGPLKGSLFDVFDEDTYQPCKAKPPERASGGMRCGRCAASDCLDVGTGLSRAGAPPIVQPRDQKERSLGVRLQADQLKAIDAWAAKQKPPVTRPGAIRDILALGLKGK